MILFCCDRQEDSWVDCLLIICTKLGSGTADSSASTPKMGSKAGESLAVAAVPFFGLFAALKIISNVSQVPQNLLKKEMQSPPLSPGKTPHGFLYIPGPKDHPRGKNPLPVPTPRAGRAHA